MTARCASGCCGRSRPRCSRSPAHRVDVPARSQVRRVRLRSGSPSRGRVSPLSNSPLRGSAAQHLSFPRRRSAPQVFVSLLSPPHLHCLGDHSAGSRPKPWSSSSSDPRNEGPAERREASRLNFVAPVRRDATLARRGPSRANRDARLSALHRGVVGPGTASVSGIAAGSGAKASRCQAIVHGRPRFRAFRIRGYERGRRHSPLRLLDRLRKTPFMSEDANLLLYIRYVVKK